MPWTADRVRSHLVQAFRELPSAPVFSPTIAIIETADPRAPIGRIWLIAATGRYLPPTSIDRRWLLTWARAQAIGAPSFSACCQEFGWARATAYRHLDRIGLTVAVGLNQDGVPLTNLRGIAGNTSG